MCPPLMRFHWHANRTEKQNNGKVNKVQLKSKRVRPNTSTVSGGKKSWGWGVFQRSCFIGGKCIKNKQSAESGFIKARRVPLSKLLPALPLPQMETGKVEVKAFGYTSSANSPNGPINIGVYGRISPSPITMAHMNGCKWAIFFNIRE